jgi:hypothetical protein
MDSENQSSGEPVSLEDFLRTEAHTRFDLAGWDLEELADWPKPRIIYRENVHPDALTDRCYESHTSFIWKVGVLSVIDGNKMDWMNVLMGYEVRPGHFEIIGEFKFEQGENADLAWTLHRTFKLIAELPLPHFHKIGNFDDPDVPSTPSYP